MIQKLLIQDRTPWGRRVATTRGYNAAGSSTPDDGDPGDAIVGAGEGGTSWDDEPATGGVFNYVWNAGLRQSKGTTPDNERNALGTVVRSLLGFRLSAWSRASRDLTQNVTNWEWTFGHALKTGTNVAGSPGVKGIVTLVKGAKGVTGTAKALNAAGKVAGNLGDALSTEQRLAKASQAR